MQIEGQNMFFKIRIGVSYWPNDADDVKKLLLNSIIALEWSALRRSSEIAFFSEKMIEQLNQENEIEGYLRQALEKEEFFIVYQPQVDSETNRMIGMEALLRWKNPKLGFVSPAVFIPIAEKNRLIIDIGNWVIKRVCEDIQYLNKTYNELMSGLRCAINLSPIQMEESGFLDKLNGTLNAFDVGRHQFEMEITEGLLLNNETRNISILEKMRDSGITIAIDDFGTGYSSMSYLNTMPIDKIKVDRTFIKNYPEYDDGKLAKILIEMAKSLELEVLTEGAETKEQVDYLKNIGCSIVQGYYYSKPLELEAFIAYLKKNIKN
jgi:EAL domain-containing protein (putative c-di-GMP-specific phosphodiesterase class I)